MLRVYGHIRRPVEHPGWRRAATQPVHVFGGRPARDARSTQALPPPSPVDQAASQAQSAGRPTRLAHRATRLRRRGRAALGDEVVVPVRRRPAASAGGAGRDGRMKELHYFDQFWDGRRARRLRRALPPATSRRPEGTITGEWTPRYMHDHWSMRLLREAAPERPHAGHPARSDRAVPLRASPARENWGLAAGRSWAKSPRRSRVAPTPSSFATSSTSTRASRSSSCSTSAASPTRSDEMERTSRFLGLEPVSEAPEEAPRPASTRRPASPTYPRRTEATCRPGWATTSSGSPGSARRSTSRCGRTSATWTAPPLLPIHPAEQLHTTVPGSIS